MRVNELFHKIFKNASTLMDKRISNSVLLSENAALNGAHLSTTSLGRYLDGEAKTKNKIKRVSLLFSNSTLQKCFTNFYQDMANLLLSNVKRPIILVDGSLFSTRGEFQFLSTSTPVGGRSIKTNKINTLRCIKIIKSRQKLPNSVTIESRFTSHKLDDETE